MHKVLVRIILIMAIVPTVAFSMPKELIQRCAEEMQEDPALDPIKGKVGFTVSSQTIEMLSNNSKPSPTEKIALLEWDKKRQDCPKKWAALYPDSEIPPAIRALDVAYASATQSLIADLYMGKLTYRQFAQKRKELQDETLAANAKIVNQLKESSYRDRLAVTQENQARAQENQARAEAQRRANMDRDMQANYLIGLGANILNNLNQPAPAPSAPRTVQCYQQGFYTNCNGF